VVGSGAPGLISGDRVRIVDRTGMSFTVIRIEENHSSGGS
jgi:hypothetical protein